MSKKHVLVVDDSFIMRTIIKDIVDSDPELEVVGFAENGKVGLERVRELKPDAILLDLEMPEMSGALLREPEFRQLLAWEVQRATRYQAFLTLCLVRCEPSAPSWSIARRS